MSTDIYLHVFLVQSPGIHFRYVLWSNHKFQRFIGVGRQPAQPQFSPFVGAGKPRRQRILRQPHQQLHCCLHHIGHCWNETTRRRSFKLFSTLGHIGRWIFWNYLRHLASLIADDFSSPRRDHNLLVFGWSRVHDRLRLHRLQAALGLRTSLQWSMTRL